MERERGDLAEDLGRDVPERRQATARATAFVGLILWREHGGELVEVAAFVVRPAARVDNFLDVLPPASSSNATNSALLVRLAS